MLIVLTTACSTALSLLHGGEIDIGGIVTGMSNRDIHCHLIAHVVPLDLCRPC